MEFSPQQAKAVDAVGAWLKDPSKQVFYLAGYAGTGKTTLAKHLASQQDKDHRFAAFTGKAASVLRRKGCNASTIHSLIYAVIPPNEDAVRNKFKEIEKEKDPKKIHELKQALRELQRPRFDLNPASAVKDLGLIVVDEVSMVDEIMGKDLESFGVKILVLGDPGQLPPVSGEGYFTAREPDFLLTEIHRQAAGNPIITMATIVRQGGYLKVGSYGDSKVRSRHIIDIDEQLAFTQTIVGMNKTRKSLNSILRDKMGYDGTIPLEGERVICLKNNKELGLLNGTQWIVRKSEDSGIYLRLHIDEADDIGSTRDEPLVVDCHHFDVDLKDMPFWERSRLEEFDFGYAITCHKSQGSQWPTVYIQNEAFVFREHAKKWLYTALTRAEEKVCVST